MEERYIRNLGALSEEECALLRTKKVFVAGCGGLGGHIIDMLLRIGIGAIAVADGDVFEESNLNRQLLSDVMLMGKSKVEAAAEYASRVNPGVVFSISDCFIDSDNAAKLIQGCDAVIDALDNIPVRLIVSKLCEELGIPIVYGAIQGWMAQCGVSMPGDRLIEKLYPQSIDSIDIKNKSSLAFTPALCASMQTALCVKLLCSKLSEHGRVYCFDLFDMEPESFFL